MERKYTLPQNLVLLISGVPGVGKTTLSNELLKIHKEISPILFFRNINNNTNSFCKSNSLQ